MLPEPEGIPEPAATPKSRYSGQSQMEAIAKVLGMATPPRPKKKVMVNCGGRDDVTVRSSNSIREQDYQMAQDLLDLGDGDDEDDDYGQEAMYRNEEQE